MGPAIYHANVQVHRSDTCLAIWDLDSRCRGPRGPRGAIDLSRGPMWRRESRSLGTKLKSNFFQFQAFIDPPGQNQLYHTPFLFKICMRFERQKTNWFTIPSNKTEEKIRIDCVHTYDECFTLRNISVMHGNKFLDALVVHL